jgi:hypothetical protein
MIIHILEVKKNALRFFQIFLNFLEFRETTSRGDLKLGLPSARYNLMIILPKLSYPDSLQERRRYVWKKNSFIYFFFPKFQV